MEEKRMSANQFPVFGANGLEGDLMDASVDSSAVSADAPISLASLPANAFRSPQPTMIFRDRAAEAEAREREQHRIEMILHPELTMARDLIQKRELEVQQWANVCSLHGTEMRRLEILVQRSGCSELHEDSEPGTRRERLAAAQERYAESREELEAAREELETAKARVQSLSQVKA
jgi:hypothetical protein